MIQLPIFKCRASAMGLLHTGLKEVTQKDLDRIADLFMEWKYGVNKNGNKVKWTDAKDAEYNKLVILNDNPQLGETAKSMLKEWVISHLTGKRKDITSKYFEHGNFAEDAVLSRASKYFGSEFKKNEIQLENDYFTGEPDSFNESIVLDSKAPFSPFTMPYFDENPIDGYYGQLQTYMALTGLNKACLFYGLEDHSEDSIDRLASKLAYQDGKEEPTMEDWDEAKKRLTYSDTPEWMRQVSYEFERNDEYIEKSKKLVVMARDYITNELVPQLEKLKNKQDEIRRN